MAAGDVYNGFRVKPEPDPLRCREENITPFTLPREALLYNPPPELRVWTFKNGDRERKIHCNIELEAHELKSLKELQEEARANNVIFYPTVTSFATRFLSRAHGDIKKAFKMMKATQEWREQYFKVPVSDVSVAEDIRYGIVYFCGRDSCLRPLLIVRPNRIPDVWYKEKSLEKMIRVLIFCMEYFIRYMSVPGKVENLNLIVDLKGLGISQVPISALAEIYKVMSNHYQGRVFSFYILNMTWMLETIAGIAKNLLTDRQKQKLRFIDKVSELYQDIAYSQLERDLGGHRDEIKTFFPFPIVAGPFDAGSTTPPDQNATRNAYRVLTRELVQAKLWNPTLSAEENTRLAYATFEEAREILRVIGISSQDNEKDKSGEAPKSNEAPPLTTAPANPTSVASSANAASTATQPAIVQQGPVVIKPVESLETYEARDPGVIASHDEVIESSGFFSCMPCKPCMSQA